MRLRAEQASRLVGLLLAACLSGSSASAESPVRELLLGHGQYAKASEQDIRDELARLGPGALDEFLAILAGRSSEPPADGTQRHLDQRGLLLAAVGRMRPSAVVAQLDLGPLRETDEILAAMQLLGATRHADAIEPMLVLTGRLTPGEFARTLVQRTLSSAYQPVFADEARAVAALADGLELLEVELIPRALPALGAAPCAAGLLLFRG